MAETGITCKTFCNRMYKCSEYKEREDYVKTSRLLFERVLRKYRTDTSQPLLTLFSDEFSNRSFTGIRAVFSNDYTSYKDFCLSCIINMIKFFEKFNVTHIMDKYNYKNKIKGYISCRIPGHNVLFLFQNLEESNKELDFASINNYIYNQVYGLSNSCLVMSVPTDSFFLIKYEELDYTMGRGFFARTKKTKVKRRGAHCKRCKNSCNALYLNGINRLEAHL